MEADTCESWLASLGSGRPEHAAILDHRERERAAAFRLDDVRDRFVLGAVLLRILAARRIGCRPHEVAVDRTCPRCGAPHGKPAVGHGVEFSIAHSGERVVVATTTVAPVGVDIEMVRGVDRAGLVDHVCAPAERGHVEGARDLLVYWTRKEAILKAAGTGLATPPTALHVTPPTDRPALLHADRPGLDCTMADLAVSPGYVGAVAVLTTHPVRFVERSAAALLDADP